MKLLKENIRQSTLTQTNMMVKNGLHEKVSFQLRHSRGRGSQEDRTAWAETLREEADWVLGELKDHGGWRSEQGEHEIEEGRERRTVRGLSGCSYQFGFHSKHSEKHWSTASEEQRVLLVMFWGPSILFPIAAAPFHNPTNSVKGSSFSTSSPTLVCCCS